MAVNYEEISLVFSWQIPRQNIGNGLGVLSCCEPCGCVVVEVVFVVGTVEVVVVVGVLVWKEEKVKVRTNLVP